MKTFSALLLTLFLACNSSQNAVKQGGSRDSLLTDVADYVKFINEEDLKSHLYIYASDEFEGRETGTAGQKKAVEYLMKHYQDLGIAPARPEEGYAQKVPLEVMTTPVGFLTVAGNTFEIGVDFVGFSRLEDSFNEIVYVGHGIEQDGYSDYQGLDVGGKIVLIKSGEPKNNDGTFLLTASSAPSKWSNKSEEIGLKGRLAKSKGVKGILYYDAESYPRFYNFFHNSKNNPNGQMQLANTENELFEAYINASMAESIVPDIDEDSKPKSIEKTISIDLAMQNNTVDSENVVAFLKGTEIPDEYVIISSHLDHIGISADGQINNGADDDGSGTVALLEIAQAFKKAADEGKGPKRSIVFLHVTGEEKGLLGSQYYTDFDPIFPLSNTVANLNIDMIGRIDPKRDGDRNYIYLIGSDKLSTELHELSEDVNSKYTNLELDYKYNDENEPNRFYYRSDHYNFAKNNIPIIFYFNGTHEDYHRPGDTPDKINYDLLKNRSRLIFYTAWEIANRDTRLKVDVQAD